MADNVNLTAGDGSIVAAADVIGGVSYPRAKVVWGADNTATDTSAANPLPVVQTGTLNVGTVSTVTNVVHVDDNSSTLSVDDGAGSLTVDGSVTANAGTNLNTSALALETGGNLATVATKTTNLVTALGSTALDLGVSTGGSRTLRVAVDSSQLSSLGQAAMASSQPVAVASNQTWPTGMSPRAFSATFTTLTRPANTTAYTAGDSISDNATAGSVTALSATVSDTNDDPITITEILVSSTDTGLAGKKLRAYLYNSNPTSNSGVGGGDNAAFSQKVAGYIGSFQGWMETGFSDGTVGRLVPTFNETNYSPAGGFIVALPTSGAKTLYIQYQAVEGFTPSANSTTIIGKAKGYQGRAA